MIGSAARHMCGSHDAVDFAKSSLAACAQPLLFLLQVSLQS